MATLPSTPARGAPRSLSGLFPFLRPYRARIALSVVFLVLAVRYLETDELSRLDRARAAGEPV